MAKVYLNPDDDPEMEKAIQRARSTFRYFWRELSWERRRIVPGLDLACVKVPFSDPPELQAPDAEAGVEQMWLSDIDFDGRVVTGTLINSPNWLKSISEGDEVNVPPKGVADWMYAINGRVYGAFTVNLMRSRMSRAERKQHDDAWGLDFGDPSDVHVVPASWFSSKPSGGGFFSRLFGKGQGSEEAVPMDIVESAEHPMAVNMADSLREFLQQDPSRATSVDELGWTMLHHESLAGTAIGVGILIEQGADPNATTESGVTPIRLAKSLGWKHVIARLKAAGAIDS